MAVAGNVMVHLKQKVHPKGEGRCGTDVGAGGAPGMKRSVDAEVIDGVGAGYLGSVWSAQRGAAGLAGLVTVGHEPFVTQRQLHSRLNEAYPAVWLEVCVGVPGSCSETSVCYDCVCVSMPPRS